MSKVSIELSTLTNIGDAIREKKGTTEEIAVTELGNEIRGIQGGGTDTRMKELIEGTLTELYDDTATSVGHYCFAYKTIDSISLPNVVSIGDRSLTYANVKDISLPNVTTIGNYAFTSATINNIYLPNLKETKEYAFSSVKGLENFTNNSIETMGRYSFQGATDLRYVSCPNVSSVSNSSFSTCGNIETVSFENAESFGNYTFRGNYKLTNVFAPKLMNLGQDTFNGCTKLEKLELRWTPYKTTGIGVRCFSGCSSLKAIVIRNDVIIESSTNVMKVENVNAFTDCYHFHGTVNETYNPNGDKDGYIYVPRALIEKYKVATNWTTLADQFRAIEDYTIDGTLDGEMDWERMGVTIE